MEKYKITIEKEEKDPQDFAYLRSVTVYQQVFTTKDNTIIENVIKSVNGITVTY